MSHHTVNGGMVFRVCYGDNTVEANQFPYLIAATYEKEIHDTANNAFVTVPDSTWTVTLEDITLTF